VDDDDDDDDDDSAENPAADMEMEKYNSLSSSKNGEEEKDTSTTNGGDATNEGDASNNASNDAATNNGDNKQNNNESKYDALFDDDDNDTKPAIAAPTTNKEDDNTPTGPQVQVIDGQIVIQESTLLANPNQRVSREAIDAEFGGDDAVMEEDQQAQLGAIQATYNSFKEKKVPKRWLPEETRTFYRALRQCGCDFGMMQMFLPKRTRNQLKRKFKVEQRMKPRLVDMALDPKMRVKLDLSVFGNKLEIPDQVPTFSAEVSAKKEEPVDDDDDDAGGSAKKKKKEGGQTNGVKKGQGSRDGSNGMESKYDSLFNDDDGNAERKEDVVVVDETKDTKQQTKSSTMGQGGGGGGSPKKRTTNSPTSSSSSPTKSNAAKKTPQKKKKAQEESPPAIVPLAPIAPSTKTKPKKARFKVKPKMGKKSKKK